MKFSESQLKAINHYTGNCMVVAAAGSGKTSVLVHRIANLITAHQVPPDKILALTFGKKAKENISDRLDRLLPAQSKHVNIETFHSLGYKILQSNSSHRKTLLTKSYEKKILLSGVTVNQLRLYKSENDVPFDALFQAISMYKSSLSCKTSKIKELLPISMTVSTFKKIFSLYEQAKSEIGKIEFDDMCYYSVKMLKEHREILDKIQNQYDFILVDEMQDTNHIQNDLITLIGANSQNMFVVGDFLQCIYEWRGSDNHIMMEFPKMWKYCKVININTNYRSSQDIVTMANSFADFIPESKNTFWRPSVADKPENVEPSVALYGDEFEEAQRISLYIQNHVAANAYKLSDIAILARTNAQLQLYESALYNLQIPYKLQENVSLTSRPEIKIVMYYLRLINDLYDNEAFKYVFNKPNRYLGNKFLDKVKSGTNKSYYLNMNAVLGQNWMFDRGIKELKKTIETLRNEPYFKVSFLIERLRNLAELDTYLSKNDCTENMQNEKLDNVDTLEKMAEPFCSLPDFINYISKLKDNPTDNAVTLSTIHKSKGLEFPLVYLIGLIKQKFPHPKNKNLNEEKRLMYVAITRAEKELHMSYTLMNNKKPVDMSPFLNHF